MRDISFNHMPPNFYKFKLHLFVSHRSSYILQIYSNNICITSPSYILQIQIIFVSYLLPLYILQIQITFVACF